MPKSSRLNKDVVDGSRLHDTNWVKQNLYEDQLKAAQIVVVSHTDVMTFEDDQRLYRSLG
jgi:G3E family GTPase